MSMYLTINNINGDVTTQGFQNSILLHSVQEGMKRFISPMKSGKGTGRETSGITYQELKVLKSVDNTSVSLYTQAHKQPVIPSAKITFVRTGGTGNPQPYLEYDLSNVLISGIYTITPPNDACPLEYLTLNFTKMQKRYTPTDSSHTVNGPAATSYDIAAAKLS